MTLTIRKCPIAGPNIRILIGVAVLGLTCYFGGPVAMADETDQFLTWGIELSDAAPAINAYLDEKIHAVLAEKNADPGAACDCEEITSDIFASIYLNRFRADLLEFIEDTERIEVCPTRELSHSDLMNRSIYRDVSFPYIIRVARSIRVGDVYVGIDKLAHFFGIGRRYYLRYLQDLRDGLDKDAAVDNAILWGVYTENTFLGKGITGIFSHADLEGNYQGLRLARSFCEGPNAYLRHDGTRWTLSRPVDLREYVTPAFDESYYPPLYAGEIREVVLPFLTEVYAEKTELAGVLQRFQGYAHSTPSRSMKVVEKYLREHSISSQRDQFMDALEITVDHPVAPLDPYSVDRNVRESPCD